MLGGRSAVVSSVHPSKALLPIDVTEVGKVMVVIPVQLLKERAPIVVNPLVGKVTAVIVVSQQVLASAS